MRLFTAIELPPELLHRLERLISALRPEALIKWSPLNNLHITTKFVGEWPEARIEELHHALESVPRPRPFEVEIKDLGWFPQERSPRVLWAGVHAGPELTKLAHDTEAALEALGVAKEGRDFTPHLTLARIKSPVPLQRLRNRVNEMQPSALGSFPVSGFVLYRSEPGSNASVYRKLRDYPFECAKAAGTI